MIRQRFNNIEAFLKIFFFLKHTYKSEIEQGVRSQKSKVTKDMYAQKKLEEYCHSRSTSNDES
jgi:hypothetical protein